MQAVLRKKREWALLLILAGIQFTHVLDFMIMMPLGPELIHTFSITDAQFGLLVSAYTFAAGVSGLMASLYIDKFERKRLLMILYGLFGLATLACGFAPTYQALMFARIGAGMFGGVLSAMSQTIVGDVIPFEGRGKAMGVIMTAFSVSTVMGVPLGLYIATHSSWNAPFVGIALLSFVLIVCAAFALPLMGAHLTRTDRLGVFQGLQEVVFDRNHFKGFCFSFCMIFGSFSIIPYITLYMRTNVGLSADQIPLIYLTGGACTLVSAQVLGRMTDKWGKVRTFRYIASLAMIPMALVTVVQGLPLAGVLVVTTCFFVFVSGRMIPGMALLTSAAQPSLRGTFMTLNSSVQSAGMGLAALIGGLLISRNPDGLIQGYWLCSVAAILFNLLAMYIAGLLKVKS